MPRESYWDYMSRKYKEEESKALLLSDEDMLIRLHDTARMLEDADVFAGKEMRQIADRFSELMKKSEKR